MSSSEEKEEEEVLKYKRKKNKEDITGKKLNSGESQEEEPVFTGNEHKNDVKLLQNEDENDKAQG